MSVSSLSDARFAIGKVHALGPGVILVTSLLTSETPDECIDLAASDGTALYRVRTPRLDLSVNGAGCDCSAVHRASFAQRISGGSLGRAAASVYGLLKRTAEAVRGKS